MARWLSWLERRPVTAEVDGSNPFRVAFSEREEIERSLLFFYRKLRCMKKYSSVDRTVAD